MTIKSFPYNDITEQDRQSLKQLFYLVWDDKDTKDIHPAEMNVISFCTMEGSEIISYAGVVSWPINVKDESFKMCGLSCVFTHPEYRKRGIGNFLVKKVTEWIIQCDRFDIGLFTCSQENTSFYEHIGLWDKCPHLVLKESNREGAYVSRQLQLNVFRLLISTKAKRYAELFENTTITLDFPEKKFI